MVRDLFIWKNQFSRDLCYKYLEFNSFALIQPPQKIKNKIKNHTGRTSVG